MAPSPTGAQHVGNARTYLLAWLSVRAQGGRLILRIEDIDSPRIKPGADQQAIEDLRWLGLDWDEGPDVGGPHAPYVQLQRVDGYRAALRELIDAQRVYPCVCSRSDIEAAASAPHAGQEGPIYPGTCRGLRLQDIAPGSDRRFAWRSRVDDLPPIAFDDRIAGRCECNLAGELGDFVVWKSDDGPAYQLAVVVDDHAMGVNEVVRGDDLIPSAFRQLALHEFFGWRAPAYAHVPLVVGPDGRRLAKRHGDTRLATLRSQGVSSQRLTGWLAWSAGLIDRLGEITPRELLAVWDPAKVNRRASVFDEQALAWLVR